MKHQPTIMAEASLNLHQQHAKQAERARAMDRVEAQAVGELKGEGKALTVRNIVTRQYEILARDGA